MKNLVIVESPAKAKTIEKFLGPDYKVMSSFGHIRDLKKRGISVDVDGDFTPIYEIPADKKELVRKLKAAAGEAGMVWLASDEDREGEAIAWHLAEVLGLDPVRTRRIVFHEITKPAILAAIANPRGIDLDRVNAQQARRVLDRIVGFELSPVLWKKIKPSLSAGRVQSVAVRLICEREKEVKGFVPVPYFRVTAVFITPDGKKLKAECPTRFVSEEKAIEFLKECRDSYFRISDISVRPVTRKPQPPFTTSTLQQEAGKRLGFSVNTTMSVAQKLYEAGQITYMRTDSTNLSETALSEIARAVIDDYGKEYSRTRRYHTSSKGAQEAHETGVDIERVPAGAEPENPGGNQAGAEKFHTEGETVKFDGFMKAYTVWDEEEEDGKGGGLLPAMTPGMELRRDSITATERFSQAPARYTEASLVKKMEDLGIGRPSTYAPTISTIQARGYIEHGGRDGTPRDFRRLTLTAGEIEAETLSENTGSDRGRLVPTDTGMVVNDFLTEYFPAILDYNFTARVEEKFDEISEGKLPWRNEMEDFYKSFHPHIEKADSMRLDHKVGERVLGTDPASGRRVSVKIGRFGPVVQIGEASDEEKPQFASLAEGQSLASITLEEALKLFELPRTVGEFEGKPVTAAIGRFGPYVLHDKVFVSIPGTLAPQTITLDEAVALIEEKRSKEANRLIKTFDELPGVEVLNGRFGPYIALHKEGQRKSVNYKIPKGTDPASLTADRVKEIMEAQDAAPKTPRRRKSAK